MINARVRSLTRSPFRYIKIAFLYFGFYLLFVLLFSRNIADNDLWGYLSFGSIFWEEGYFPFHDVFSYTPTKSTWIYHEWLTGVFFYLILKYLGPAGLQLLNYIVILLTIYLIYLAALEKGGDPLSAAFALIPAMLLISFGYVPVRAQIFTYLFFIMTLYILETARKVQNWSVLWWLLPIQALWCNFHGGFVAGLGLIILYALGDALSGKKATPFFKIAALANLVTLINPYGIQYWNYTIQTILMPRPEIEEWISVVGALKNNIQDVPALIFLLLSFVCAISLAFRSQTNLTDLLVAGVAIYLGCRHIRHSVFLGLVFGAYVPVVLAEYWSAWRAKRIFFTRWAWASQSLLTAFMFLFYLVLTPSFSLALAPSFTLATPPPLYPTGAVQWIKTNGLRGNILAHFDWGEYLIWTCYPSCRVAMDGRYETVYEEHVYREYFDFLMGREKWHIFLRKYPHDMVLIKPNTKTHLLMLTEPCWQVAYSDRGCVLFINKGINNKRQGETG